MNKTALVYAWAVVMTVLFSLSAFLNLEGLTLHQELRSFCAERLKRDVPLPASTDGRLDKAVRAIYVLGGDQGSLEYRYEVAAGLYRDGAAGKVLVLKRPGVTAYDAVLDRNLTNDEWSIRQLASLGVDPGDIEAVSIEEGFFGTLAEARGVSRAIRQRGYAGLILVTSPYHTERAWRSFVSASGPEGPALYVYSSRDWGTLAGLVIEYFKLLAYEAALI